MFTSDLAKCTWLLYVGLILGHGVLSQGWMNGFPDWTGFMDEFHDFGPPPTPRWDFGLDHFVDRMIRNGFEKSARQMRHNLAHVRTPQNTPEMRRLLHQARRDFAAEGYQPGFRSLVRMGTCGPGCRMKVVLTRNNGAYSERYYQTSP